jgi:hypothetical protein
MVTGEGPQDQWWKDVSGTNKIKFLKKWGGGGRGGADGYAQHGGPPGWLEESDPPSVILFVMAGTYRLPFPYRNVCPDWSSTAVS